MKKHQDLLEILALPLALIVVGIGFYLILGFIDWLMSDPFNIIREL